MSTPDDALSVHVVFFDVDRDGRITRAEIDQAMQELGFSRLVSALAAPVLAVALPADVAKARSLRHDDTGALAATGEFDEDAFLAWFEGADRDGSGTLSRGELLRSSLEIADDPVSFVASVGELQLLHLLLAEDGGLHRAAASSFMSGDLFRELIDRRSQPQ